jgi:hypothetical protein
MELQEGKKTVNATKHTRGRLARAGLCGALVAAGSVFAALGAGAGTASAHTVAPHISKAECAANRAAGTMTYVSPFGFDASAGIIDIFAAQKLGYFADMCIKVAIIPTSYIGNLLVSSGSAQITNEGSAADTLLAIGPVPTSPASRPPATPATTRSSPRRASPT